MDPKVGPRVLLVEDEAIIAMSEQEELASFGYDIVVAGSGEEALAICRDDPGIDLVLMDIDLGRGMDGPQTAELILRLRDLPVVFLSCHTEPEVVEKTEQITSYGYIVKNSSYTAYDASIKMALRLFEANRRLKESEQKQKSMISNISDVIAIVDEQARVRFLSDNADRLFGWRPDFLLGTDGRALVHESDARRVRENLNAVLRKDPPAMQDEFRVRREDGSFAAIEMTAANMVADPVIRGVLLNFRDISERKALQERQETANRRFQAVLDAIPEYICWKDRSSVFLGCNKNHAGLFGLPDTDSVVGKTDWELHRGAQEIAKYIQDDSEVMERDEPRYRIVERALYPDGSQRWLETNKVPLHDAAGKVYGIMIAYSDITERKWIEDSLAQERYLMDALMDNSSDYIYFKDAEGRFTRTSRAHAVSLGLADPALMVGRTDFDFYQEEFARRTLEDELTVLREGRALRKEEEILRKDGSAAWVLLEKLPLRDKGGAIVGTFGISRDITDRKLAERRIRDLLEEKELLLHEVHHRIKNSLSTVCGLLSLQAAYIRDQEGIKALEDTERRVRSMMLLYELLYDTASFSEVRVGVYLRNLVDQVVASFPGTARVEYSLEDFAIEPEYVQPLGIIVNELVTNAMKYAFVGRQGGLVSVSASAREGLIRLSVRDDGLGMPESVDFDRSPGFGLTLVRSLARQLDGSVRIERGGGTGVVLEFGRP